VPSTGGYLVIGGAAAVLTFVSTPIVGWFARRRSWLAEPNQRTVHTHPIPNVGGIALFIGFAAAFALARSLDRFDPLFRAQLGAAWRPGRRSADVPGRPDRRHPRVVGSREGDGERSSSGSCWCRTA
jgi:hypothetical protein